MWKFITARRNNSGFNFPSTIFSTFSDEENTRKFWISWKKNIDSCGISHKYSSFEFKPTNSHWKITVKNSIDATWAPSFFAAQFNVYCELDSFVELCKKLKMWSFNQWCTTCAYMHIKNFHFARRRYRIKFEFDVNNKRKEQQENGKENRRVYLR